MAVEDANGNIETGDHATTVTLAIGINPGGGTLTGGSATDGGRPVSPRSRASPST